MLTFDKNYFNGETICDFYVDPMVKRAWAAQLEILTKIIEICNNHNLTYYGFWGTMLGAIRHKGFIPWDDDIDIVMKRKDYDIFLEIAQSELPAKYLVLSPYSQVEWKEQFSRVTNSHSINFSESHLIEFHGFPYITGIDIFPYDYIPDNKEIRDNQLYFLNKTAHARSQFIKTGNIPENDLLELERTFGFEFNRSLHLDNQLLCLFDQISACFGNESDSKLTCFADRMKSLTEKKKDFYFDKEWFSDVITVPFENIRITIPKNYKQCLITCFGEDYMTPIMGTSEHEYPFYKKQENELKEIGRYEEVMAAVNNYTINQ